MKSSRLKHISIILILLIIAVILCFMLKNCIKNQLGYNYMTETQLEEILNKYFREFSSTASDLSEINRSITIKSNDNSIRRDDWDYKKIDNHMVVVSYKSDPSNDEDITAIEKSYSSLILKKLNFEKIEIKNGIVYFQQTSNLDFAVGIAYNRKDNQLNKEYLYDVHQIKKNWYYYEIR